MENGSELLRAYLGSSKKNRVEFAVALGVSPSTVHYWLHGSVPREATRKRIARATRGAVPADAWLHDVARAG